MAGEVNGSSGLKSAVVQSWQYGLISKWEHHWIALPVAPVEETWICGVYEAAPTGELQRIGVLYDRALWSRKSQTQNLLQHCGH